MPFRPKLKQLAGFLGFAIASRQHAAINFLDTPPTTAFDLALLHCFSDLHGLTFIQVGANDGSRADPLQSYINRYDWTGVMFEPLAENFSQLKKLHGKNPRLKLRQAAVDSANGRRNVYSLNHAKHPSLPDWSKGTGSFSRERVAQVAGELGLNDDDIVSEETASISWAHVWSEINSTQCDLLILDTEGYDLQLLRSAQLSKYRPKLIHFEHACVSTDKRLEFYRELLELGYEIFSDGPDTTAWRKG